MNNLTAEKCRDRIERLKACKQSEWGLSIDGEYQLQALEIALPVLEKQESKPQIDNDGWIEWVGGECPVPDGTKLDIKFRDGDILFDEGTDWVWQHKGMPGDIIAYRVIDNDGREG